MRKTKEITISDASSRDNGTMYLITEMPASQTERWALRVLAALTKSGFDPALLAIDRDDPAGMETLVRAGLETVLGRLDVHDLEPLLDEMMTCVQVSPSPGITRRLVEEDIQEVKTRLLLKREVFKLHVDFFENADPSTLTSQEAKTAGSETA